MSLVTHGVPVVSSRQWTTALSPNAAGDGWNFIAASYNFHTQSPVEWVVVKNLTDTPSAHSTQIYDTTTGHYPNANILYTKQIRATNGRIFFPLFLNDIAYYDPVTESVHALGPFVESPPINPNASTIPYSSTFDTSGTLYLATQESQNRPSCVVSVEPDSLAVKVLGYVGESSNSYTTYGYTLVADTGTASKYVYVAYGEDPWQLWALKIDDGTATKLYEVTSAGHISFSEINGQGWIATVDTNVGQPSNVRTQWWCQDGAISAYAVGQPSSSPRDVTPASNPLVNPPTLDTTPGIGRVGWKFGSEPYTYVNYSVTFTVPGKIESLVETPDGVLGNAEQYQGFFRYVEPTDTHTWFGAASGLVSGGPRALLGTKVYFAGYPNGALYVYDTTAAWEPNTNPVQLGFYGPNGTELAGVKYVGYFAWSASAGRLYCSGTRDRSGTGAGIGYYDITGASFGGTFASPLDTVQPKGLVALDSLGYVVLSTNTLSGSGTAPLLVFDHDLSLIAQHTVISNLPNIGVIVPTANPAIVCGVVQGSNSSLGLWQFNVQTSMFIQYTELPITGTLGVGTLRTGDGSYWLLSGSSLVRVDPSAMTAASVQDLSAVSPVVSMSFGGDGETLFMAGGADSSGSQIWSLDLPLTRTVGPPAHGTIRAIAARGLLRANQGRATIRNPG